jgi:phospholipid/cholesterol/gamma-HCH transport system substrate-binding protein
MSAPTNHWKLGLFVTVGFVLSLTTVAVLGARSLQKEVVRYVSYFDESVQGLETGSPIKFRGVTIGTVGKIDVAPDHRLVEVTSELGVAELNGLGLDVAQGGKSRGEHTKLTVATDLRVQLASMGLTGVKFLQLDFFVVADNPPPTLPFPAPENYIPAAPSTMKNLEDSVVRTMNRLPEIADQLSVILKRVDNVLGDVEDKHLPDQVLATLGGANQVIAEAQKTLAHVEVGKLSKQAQKTLDGLDVTVTRMNSLLARVDGDKGLLASVGRASDAVGDTARNADGLGSELEETLRAVQEAAKSIHKLTDALEKDPDMLLKGRAQGKR